MFGKEKYKDINKNLNRRFEEKKVLIAVHRGVWCGNIIENTVEAYDACRVMGADLFECDLSETTDGVLYMFHDGGEWRVLGKDQSILTMSSAEVDSLMCRNGLGEPSGRYLQRYEQLLKHYKNGELFNVDRSWPSLAKLDEIMQKYPHAISQAVIKTPVKEEYLEFFQNCPNNICICRLHIVWKKSERCCLIRISMWLVWKQFFFRKKRICFRMKIFSGFTNRVFTTGQM